MASTSKTNLFWNILNISVGAMLAVGGIWALQGGGDFGCRALSNIFHGDTLKIARIAFGVIELLSGVFIILQLFIGDMMGSLGKILKLVIVVVWIIAIVFADFLGSFLEPNFLSWTYDLAMHLIVLCALVVTRD